LKRHAWAAIALPHAASPSAGDTMLANIKNAYQNSGGLQ
jgi:hypothetical protein